MGFYNIQGVFLVLIIFINVMQRTCSQTVTVNVADGSVLCPGQEIVFRCEVRNSLTIAWRSNEYIQRDGNTLRFATFENPGITKSNVENPTSIATFVSESSDTLVSDLRIIVSSVYPTFSVTCLHNDGTTDLKSFQVTTPPDAPQEMITNQTKDMSKNCVLHLSWSSPSNIDTNDLSHYMIYLNGSIAVNETHATNTSWQLFANQVCCGSHNVSIRAVNTVGCVGPSTDIQTVVPVALPVITCLADDEPNQPTTTSTTSTDDANATANAFTTAADQYCDNPSGNPGLVAGITILSIAVVVIPVIVCIALGWYIKTLLDKIKQLQNEVNELKGRPLKETHFQVSVSEVVKTTDKEEYYKD